MAYPAISRDSVVLPAPDPPMMAVSVPGRAVIVMFSSSALSPTLNPTSRTSRPPVRVAASARRTRLPPVNTRSTLPIVTTSPSVSRADPTRIPLTNVPLMLFASRISVPSGVGTRYAWWREASTSWMTMSLSIARPIRAAPAGAASRARGPPMLSFRVGNADTEWPMTGAAAVRCHVRLTWRMGCRWTAAARNRRQLTDRPRVMSDVEGQLAAPRACRC